MKRRILQSFLLLSAVLLLVAVGLVRLNSFIAPTHAQGADDAKCREIFPEIYSIHDQNPQVGVYCVNTSDDGTDYSVMKVPAQFDGICDSNQATAGNQCTLRAAIMEASAPPASNQDYILLPAGTYYLTIPDVATEKDDENSGKTGDLDILSSVHLKGENKEEVIIDAQQIHRIFHNRYDEADPTSVEISNVTIRNGSAPTVCKLKAGAILNNGYITLTNVIVENYNYAGVYNIRNSTAYTSTMIITNSVIKGGGVSKPSDTGLYVSGGTVLLYNSKITNNFSKGDGAGINIVRNDISFADVELFNTTVSDNTAQGFKGGGIYVGKVGLGKPPIFLALFNSTVSGNAAKYGGGIYVDGESTASGPIVWLDSSTVSGNSAAFDHLDVEVGQGGGIYMNSPITMTLETSTISGNSAESHGGGIYVNETTSDKGVRAVILNNSTVAKNIANVDGDDRGDGGGIYLKPRFNTVGGAYVLDNAKSGKAILKNSILADNVDGSTYNYDQYPDCGQCNKDNKICGSLRFYTVGYNLIGNNRSCDDSFPASGRNPKPFYPNNYLKPNVNSDWVGSDRKQDDTIDNLTGPIDPQLLPLRNNGGGVQTHALLTSDEPAQATALEKRSFAIDNGDCLDPSLDQRKATRPQDGDNSGKKTCDIGAYEVMPQDISILAKANLDEVASSQALTYTLEFVNQGSLGATQVYITDLIPSWLINTKLTNSGAKISLRPGQQYIWDVADLKPGDGGIITITGIIDPELGRLVVMKNAATIASLEVDDMPNNNSSLVETIARPGANLSISMVGSRNPAPVAKTISYTVLITNSGPARATGVVVVDTIPTGMAFKTATPICSLDTKNKALLICKVSTTLLKDATTKFVIELTTPTTPMTVTNKVEISSSLPDPAPNDNRAEVTTQVLPDVDLEVSMVVAPTSGTTGQPLTYTITITNKGPQEATNITLKDIWPDTVEMRSVTPKGLFSCDNIDDQTRTVICSLAKLANGKKEIVDMVVRPLFAGSIKNYVWVNTSSADSNPSNNFAGITTTVKQGSGTPIATYTPSPTSPPGTPMPTQTPTVAPTPTPTSTPIPVLPEVKCLISTKQGCVVYPLGTGNDWIKLEFPAGAVSYTTTVTLIAGGAIPHPENSSLRFAVRAFKATAKNDLSGPVSVFQKPYTITLRYIYNDYEHLFTAPESRRILDLYYWDGTQWLRAFDPANPCAGCSRSTSDTDIGTVITVNLNHLTEFALMAEMKTVYLPVIVKK